MRKNVESQLNEIEVLLSLHPEGCSRLQISGKLGFAGRERTLQRRLSELVSDKRITRNRLKNTMIYFPVPNKDKLPTSAINTSGDDIFSQESREKLKFLETSVLDRDIAFYNPRFLENYKPNVSQYVSLDLRKKLLRHGVRFDDDIAAGTYAKQISQRLLIDLSYNSSRLEGNTYTQLETEQLIHRGISAKGKLNRDTIMILNHKDAIRMIIDAARDIEINSDTITDLHAILSEDLLQDPTEGGTIRKIPVAIRGSTYLPMDDLKALRAFFNLLLKKAQEITDPFEQCFFLLVQVPYLQAFADVNKRTSRISCNIPLIKGNLCPLSFVGVPQKAYTSAIYAVYERNEILPMLDVFEWAYIKSCLRYDVVRNSLGSIDSYRIKYRRERKEITIRIIVEKLHLDSSAVVQRIEEFCKEREIIDPEKFKLLTLKELAHIRNGYKLGLRVSKSQLRDWINLHSD